MKCDNLICIKYLSDLSDLLIVKNQIVKVLKFCDRKERQSKE